MGFVEDDTAQPLKYAQNVTYTISQKFCFGGMPNSSEHVLYISKTLVNFFFFLDTRLQLLLADSSVALARTTSQL